MIIFSRRLRPATLLLVALFCFNFAAHAQGFSFLGDEAESGGFDITAEVTKLPVEWSLNQQENGDAYRLRLTPTSAELSVQMSGKASPLASAKTTIVPGPIVIQRRGPRWVVLSGNRIVLQAENDRWMEGKVGHRGGEVKSARFATGGRNRFR